MIVSRTTSGTRPLPSLAPAEARCNRASPRCGPARSDGSMASSSSAARENLVGVLFICDAELIICVALKLQSNFKYRN